MPPTKPWRRSALLDEAETDTRSGSRPSKPAMTVTIARRRRPKLELAMAKASQLPEPAQEALGREMLERIEALAALRAELQWD